METRITRRAFLVGGVTLLAGISSGWVFRSDTWRRAVRPGRPHILSGPWRARHFGPGDRGELVSNPIGGNSLGWIPAVVPGTVITTLVAAGEIDDPHFGTNYLTTVDVNEDPDLYTYWFLHDFTYRRGPTQGARHWLRFRGINYTASVWLNGIRLTSRPLTGMFLRHEIDVTDHLRPSTNNRLVLLVEPPRPPGNPQPKTPEPPTFEPGMASSCQGEDHLIGRSVTAQFSGGWDFVQPQRDRNVGIWDKVEIHETGPVRFATRLVEPGFDNTVSYGGAPRIDTKIVWDRDTASVAHVAASMLLQNSTSGKRRVGVRIRVGNRIGRTEVQLPGHQTVEVNLRVTLNHPELWWPNGHGDQRLYDVAVDVFDLTIRKQLSDRFECKLGIREIRSYVDGAEIDPNNFLENGRVFEVNKKRIFIRGGCWTFPDARLRHDAQNYDDQVRLHAMMNLNLIRLWGGGLTERPEFYEACDKYGILVWQEFWITADCNSGGENPRDPDLFMLSALDAISLIRNHSSLAIWVGGNEGPPPGLLNERLRRAVATNDPDRAYVPYSTDPRAGFGLHSGAFTDGPYRIVEPRRFFDASYSTHLRKNTGTPVAYNPEYGSVGMPVSDTVRMIMAPEDYNDLPDITERTWPSLNEAWISHTYIPFFTEVRGMPLAEDQINLYGKPTTLDEFCEQAQAAQYLQYKALLEGRNAHMWTWYTGGNIWRSAPGWSSLRGGLYDAFLETTGGHAGVAIAGRSVHVQVSLVDGSVQIINNSSSVLDDLVVWAHVCDSTGRIREDLSQRIRVHDPVEPNSMQTVGSLRELLELRELHILRLELHQRGVIVDRNLDWFANSRGPDRYQALRRLPLAETRIEVVGAQSIGTTHHVRLKMENVGQVIAFFLRLQVFEQHSGERILPVFASENYLSIFPGKGRDVALEFRAPAVSRQTVRISGWNVAERSLRI